MTYTPHLLDNQSLKVIVPYDCPSTESLASENQALTARWQSTNRLHDCLPSVNVVGGKKSDKDNGTVLRPHTHSQVFGICMSATLPLNHICTPIVAEHVTLGFVYNPIEGDSPLLFEPPTLKYDPFHIQWNALFVHDLGPDYLDCRRWCDCDYDGFPV